LIDDSDLSEAVGSGQHTFHNYSHRQYGCCDCGKPWQFAQHTAVKTLQIVGEDAFMERLHLLASAA